MSKIDYVQFYGLILPVNEQEMFEALVQIQDKRECWRPEIAARCRDLIKQIVATSPRIPSDEKEVLTGNICNLLSMLGSWEKENTPVIAITKINFMRR